MSKGFISLVAVAVGLMLSGRALACDSASGAVARIDTAKSTLFVSGGGCGQKEMSFVLKKDTRILVNGKAATLADLRAGDKVKIDYEKTDDVLSVAATREG